MKINEQSVLYFTAFLSTFASSLFWTGFPMMLVAFSGQHISLSFTYSFATFGSLAFDILGGVFSDAMDVRKLAVRSLSLSVLLMLVLVVLFYFNWVLAALCVLPFIYFNFALGFIAESSWLLKLGAADLTKNRFLNRNSLTILSKIGGFALGPLLFGGHAVATIFLSACLFAACAIVQSIFAVGAARRELESDINQLSSRAMIGAVLNLFQRPLIAITFVVTGMMTVPINPIFVSRLIALKSDGLISLYWAGAGVASLAAMMCLRRFDFVRSKTGRIAMPVFCLFCVYVLLFSNDSRWILATGCMYAFSSVALSASLQMNIIAKFSKSEIGSGLGAMNFLIDLGVFIGMLCGSQFSLNASDSINHLPVIGASFLLAALIVLRSYSQHKLLGDGVD